MNFMVKTTLHFVSFSVFGAMILASCGQGSATAPESTQNSTSSSNDEVEVSSSEKAYTFLNSTPEAALVNVPTAAEQAALDVFNTRKNGKLIEGFNINQPSAPLPSRSINFTEATYSSPYLVCYYNSYNSTTRTTQVVWKWALDTYYYSSWRSSYWYKNGYYNFASSKGQELRQPSLAFVSDKSNAALKQACENTRQYWIQNRSSWAYSDMMDPAVSGLSSNATFVYYTEAKSSLGYNRHVFAIDKLPRTKFTSLVAFGDSLSDTGNLSRRTGGSIPRKDYYYNGRFSNGYNWMDDIQYTLNLPIYNSAYASAETNNKVNYGLPLSVLAAIDDYESHKGVWSGFYYGGYVGQASYGAGDPATTLFSVYAGGNNYLDFVADGATGVQFNDPKQSGNYLNTEDFTTQTVKDLEDAVNKIIALGGKAILLPNLPDLSNVPQGKYSSDGKTPSPYAPELSIAISKHNAKLYTKVQELAQANQSVSFIHMDVNAMLQEVTSNSAVYGFKVIDKPCYVGEYYYVPGEKTPTVCGDESAQKTYVFWDSVHPTKRAHGFIAYLLNNYLYANFKKQ